MQQKIEILNCKIKKVWKQKTKKELQKQRKKFENKILFTKISLHNLKQLTKENDNNSLTYKVSLQEICFQNKGSQTFGICVPITQKSTPLCTPESNLTPWRTPKTPFVSLLLGLFLYELYLRVPPANCLCTPRGTRTPGWEPLHWSRTRVLSLLVLAYLQIEIVPLCKPPNRNCTPLQTSKSKL